MSDSKYVQGTDTLKAHIEQLSDFKREFGKEALARVKSYTPVDTGLLRSSWTLTIGKTIEIANEAQNKDGDLYAIFVEYGTIHMRPFLMATRTMAEAEDIAAVARQRAGL